MQNTPDISFFFAVHRKMRTDSARYARAVQICTEADRSGRLRSLERWAAGFVHELVEHHFVEDEFFFPDMRARVTTVGAVLEGLSADHRTLDGLLERWPGVAARLADRNVPFNGAKADALELATALRDLLARHLDIEDNDVLPLYHRHYTAAEYDAVYTRAMKGGKTSGLCFVVPWSVDCVQGAERAALLALAPLPLRLVWRATRGRYDRLVASAFEGVEDVVSAR